MPISRESLPNKQFPFRLNVNVAVLNGNSQHQTMTQEHASSMPLSPTISSFDESHIEKITNSSHESDSRPQSGLDSYDINGDAFVKASDMESWRGSLYQVNSYASHIGGEGGLPDAEEAREKGEKDPNLVEWDDPNDCANPYNW